MIREPFKNRVWRCIGAAVAGSAIGSVVMTGGFLVVQLAERGTLDVVGPGSFDALSFLLAVMATGSLIFTLPSAILVLLPLEMRYRQGLARSPGRATAAMAGLAATAGCVIMVAVGVIPALPAPRPWHWTEPLALAAVTLPFSIPAALVLAWRTRRAISRAERRL